MEGLFDPGSLLTQGRIAESIFSNSTFGTDRLFLTGNVFCVITRNFPREDKVSPAELMFGRRQNTKLPTLPSPMTQVDRSIAIKNKDELAKKHTEYFNKSAKPLSVFEPGESVRVNCPKSSQDKTTTSPMS